VVRVLRRHPSGTRGPRSPPTAGAQAARAQAARAASVAIAVSNAEADAQRALTGADAQHTAAEQEPQLSAALVTRIAQYERVPVGLGIGQLIPQRGRKRVGIGQAVAA
jgi:hypothetical protein